MKIQESYHEIGKLKLRVLHSLKGDETPLFIFNGIGASADMLRPLIESIKVPVITLDLPGVGASNKSLLPRPMFNLARIAKQVLDIFEIDKCHVMGISWGGALAQQFAWQYSQRTDHLILAATSAGQIMVPPKLSVMVHMATPLRYLNSRYFRSIAGTIYGGDFRNNQSRASRHAKVMAPPSVSGYINQLFAISGWTSFFVLPAIKAPALIMAGEDDPIIPLANARILARRLPNAELKTYDCGHLFILTRLDQVVSDLDTFLAA